MEKQPLLELVYRLVKLIVFLSVLFLSIVYWRHLDESGILTTLIAIISIIVIAQDVFMITILWRSYMKRRKGD